MCRVKGPVHDALLESGRRRSRRPEPLLRQREGGEEGSQARRTARRPRLGRSRPTTGRRRRSPIRRLSARCGACLRRTSRCARQWPTAAFARRRPCRRCGRERRASRRAVLVAALADAGGRARAAPWRRCLRRARSSGRACARARTPDARPRRSSPRRSPSACARNDGVGRICWAIEAILLLATAAGASWEVVRAP